MCSKLWEMTQNGEIKETWFELALASLSLLHFQHMIKRKARKET